MKHKTLLLASFISKDKLDSFLYKLSSDFGINKHKVFIFTYDDEYILTYRLELQEGERIDIKRRLPKTVQIHKKGSTIFTINALNKLIEEVSGMGGNVDHKDYQLDWSEYENKIILITNGELLIKPIKRTFLD